MDEYGRELTRSEVNGNILGFLAVAAICFGLFMWAALATGLSP